MDSDNLVKNPMSPSLSLYPLCTLTIFLNLHFYGGDKITKYIISQLNI